MNAITLDLLIALVVIGGLVAFAFVAERWIERAVPPQGRILELDGERLHVLDAGSGPPLVMIHGLSGQMANLTHSLLERLARDFRVVAFDRPGSGYSPRRSRAEAGLGSQAASLASAIRALKLGRPTIVGHSLGGAVALKLALDHPDCVGALALVAPLTHPVRKPPFIFEGLAIRSPLLRHVVYWTVAAPSVLLVRNWGAARVFAPERPPKDFAIAGGGLLAMRPSNMNAASEDMNAVNGDLESMPSRYRSLCVPVGVLYGRDDPILDWRSQGDALKEEIPGLDLELVEGAGHMLPVTRPDLTAAFIRRIAARVAPAANAAV